MNFALNYCKRGGGIISPVSRDTLGVAAGGVGALAFAGEKGAGTLAVVLAGTGCTGKGIAGDLRAVDAAFLGAGDFAFGLTTRE